MASSAGLSRSNVFIKQVKMRVTQIHQKSNLAGCELAANRLRPVSDGNAKKGTVWKFL